MPAESVQGVPIHEILCENSVGEQLKAIILEKLGKKLDEINNFCNLLSGQVRTLFSEISIKKIAVALTPTLRVFSHNMTHIGISNGLTIAIISSLYCVVYIAIISSL